MHIAANGARTLVRDEVSDLMLARALVGKGNRGAGIRNMSYRYALEINDGPAIIAGIDTPDSAESDSG